MNKPVTKMKNQINDCFCVNLVLPHHSLSKLVIEMVLKDMKDLQISDLTVHSLAMSIKTKKVMLRSATIKHALRDLFKGKDI